MSIEPRRYDPLGLAELDPALVAEADALAAQFDAPGHAGLPADRTARIAAVYENRAVAVWSPEKPAPDKLVTLDNLSFSRVAALSGDIRAAVPLSDKTILVLSGPDLRDARLPADDFGLDQWGLVAAPAANAAFVSYSDGSIRRRDLGAGGAGTTVFDARTSLCGAPPTTEPWLAICTVVPPCRFTMNFSLIPRYCTSTSACR